MKKKSNRKEVYKWVFSFSSDREFELIDWTQETTFCRLIYKKYHGKDPSRGQEIYIWWRALLAAGYSSVIYFNDLEKVYDKYHYRFLKHTWFPRIKKRGGKHPDMNKTKAIKEFLARGFVHIDDAGIDTLKKYCVKCNIAPLWWPTDFDLHQDACEVQSRFGIQGYTGTTLPKN